MDPKKLDTPMRLLNWLESVTCSFSTFYIESQVSIPLGSETVRLVVKKGALKMRPFDETYLILGGSYVSFS